MQGLRPRAKRPSISPRQPPSAPRIATPHGPPVRPAPPCRVPGRRFAPAGSTLTCIVSKQEFGASGGTAALQETPRASPRGSGATCSISVIHHRHPTSAEALLAAGVHSAHSVVLGTPACVDDGEADAGVMCAMLSIQRALAAAAGGGSGAGAAGRLHVVAKMCGYSMRRTLQVGW